MIEKYGNYEFEIFGGNTNCSSDRMFVYRYEIYARRICIRDIEDRFDSGVIQSNEYYETEQGARYAAIGHITFLEQSE